MILEGEIKDAKISSFSSDFQTLIKRKFPLYFLNELLMSLRTGHKTLRLMLDTLPLCSSAHYIAINAFCNRVKPPFI